MMANTATGAGERMFLLKKLKSFSIFSLLHQSDKTLNTDMGRAGCFTGRCSAFGNSVATRYGLFILFKNSLAIGQPLIVLAGYLHGAHLGTFAAGCTF